MAHVTYDLWDLRRRVQSRSEPSQMFPQKRGRLSDSADHLNEHRLKLPTQMHHFEISQVQHPLNGGFQLKPT